MQTRGLISTLFLMVLTLGSVLIDLRAESASGSYLLAPVPTPSPVRKRRPPVPTPSPVRKQTIGTTSSETNGQKQAVSLPEKDDEVLIKKPSGNSSRSARTRRGRTETVDKNESIMIGAKSSSNPALKTKVKRPRDQDIEVENDETHATGTTRQIKSPASAGQLPNTTVDQTRETVEGFTSAEGRSMSFELKTQKPSDKSLTGDRSKRSVPKVDATKRRTSVYTGETEKNLNSADAQDRPSPSMPLNAKTGEVAMEVLHVKKPSSSSSSERKARTRKTRARKSPR